MAYVAPNSTLQLFKGINLDNRYLHTIYFANATAQDTWFTGKIFKTYNNMMYRRYTSEAVKVEADATELLGVTYMRFRNTRTASKWFYAFVNAVDYVNENTAVIYYEIDVMQTWFIQNGSIRPCMVLREHTNDDTIFSNLESEPVGSDAYAYDLLTDANTLTDPQNVQHTNVFNDYSLVVTTTGRSYNGYYKQGLYDGSKLDAFHCNNDTEANDVTSALQTMLGGDWEQGIQQQDVISMHTFPSAFADQSYSSNLGLWSKTIFAPGLSGNYVPKNLKLWAYPFNFLYCTTHNGSSGVFKWEYFDNGEATNRISNKEFKFAGSSIGSGQIKCFPVDYDGIDINYEQGVSMSDFPKNAFSYDAYQAWIANGGKTRLENEASIQQLRNIALEIKTGTEFATGTIGGIINTGVGAVEFAETKTLGSANRMLNGINQTVNATTQLMNNVADLQEAKNKIDYQWKDASYRPNTIVGTSEPDIMVGGRLLNFYFYNCHVVESEMQRIDDFFSTFGYSINKVKRPNLTGRAYWNFVQTEGAVIAGDMPSTSKEAIGRIFDGGITFWHNGDNVGNYSISTSEGSINNPIV